MMAVALKHINTTGDNDASPEKDTSGNAPSPEIQENRKENIRTSISSSGTHGSHVITSFFASTLRRYTNGWRPDTSSESLPSASLAMSLPSEIGDAFDVFGENDEGLGNLDDELNYSQPPGMFNERIDSLNSNGTGGSVNSEDGATAIWHNIQYMNFITKQRLSASALCTTIRDVLDERGILSVGEIGKILQDMTDLPSFSLKLKERFGGLKKFLESYSDVFIMSVDHPFNPSVFLRDGLTDDEQSLLQSALVPNDILHKFKKSRSFIAKKRHPLSVSGGVSVSVSTGSPPSIVGSDNGSINSSINGTVRGIPNSTHNIAANQGIGMQKGAVDRQGMRAVGGQMSSSFGSTGTAGGVSGMNPHLDRHNEPVSNTSSNPSAQYRNSNSSNNSNSNNMVGGNIPMNNSMLNMHPTHPPPLMYLQQHNRNVSMSQPRQQPGGGGVGGPAGSKMQSNVQQNLHYMGQNSFRDLNANNMQMHNMLYNLNMPNLQNAYSNISNTMNQFGQQQQLFQHSNLNIYDDIYEQQQQQ